MRTIFPSLPFFILLLFAFAAYGQEELKRIAILNTEDDGEPKIELTDVSYITGKLREIALNTLQHKYSVMSVQSIIDRLGSWENARKACKEAQCLAQLGVKISADYIGQARLGRTGGNLTINMELYNSGSGVLIASFTGNAKDVFGLLEVIDKKAPEMFGKMPGIVYVPEPTLVPVPVPTPVPEIAVPKFEEPIKTKHTMVAVALDIAGVVLVSAGVVANSNMQNALDRYGKREQPQANYNNAWQDVKSSRSARNIRYIAGGAALASGIGMHIWF